MTREHECGAIQVDKPRSNVLGNSTIPITNREELTRLFQTLQQGDSLVDLIVCDIFMDIPTPADSALREVLTDQGIESKLLLAHNLVNPNTDYFASLNDSVYGNVVESGYEHSFAVFKPYHKGRPSLAYLIYRKVGQLETGTSLGDLLVSEKKKNRWRSFGINCYIPHFELTQEDKIYDDNGEKGDQQHLVSQNNYFEIGDVVTYPVQQQSLLHTLYQRKSEGMKNIIFIGSFKGTSEDVHPTYYGRLHGATILLNLFCSLQAHQHRLSIWFLIYLWFFISCILFIAVRKGLGTPLFSALSAKPTPKTSIRKKNKILMGLKDSIVCIWHILILDELHFWLFAIFIFGTAIVWDRIINGLVLFILLQLIYKVFQYYAHTHKAVTANQKIRERD